MWDRDDTDSDGRRRSVMLLPANASSLAEFDSSQAHHASEELVYSLMTTDNTTQTPTLFARHHGDQEQRSGAAFPDLVRLRPLEK